MRIDGKDFVMQEWMRSGVAYGCRTETHLHIFFLAVIRHAAVNERNPAKIRSSAAIPASDLVH